MFTTNKKILPSNYFLQSVMKMGKYLYINIKGFVLFGINVAFICSSDYAVSKLLNLLGFIDAAATLVT